MKKLLALATALVLMGVFLPLMVSASTPVSNVTQLRNALEWGDGGTFTLTADINVVGNMLEVNTTSTLDLNGHTLTINTNMISGINISQGSTFTIMCSIGTGVLNATAIRFGIVSMGDLNINGGTVNATGNDRRSAGIDINNGGEMTINGGTVNAEGGNQGVGISVVWGSELNISGGTVNAEGGNGDGIVLSIGELNISGGEVNATGGTGIAVGLNSKLNISGGTVSAGGWGSVVGITVDRHGAMSISGGTVNAVGNFARIDGFGTVINGAGVPVFLNILTTNPLHVNSAVTSASFSGASYGVNDVRTNASGQLFFYLPATNAAHNATVRIGGRNFTADYIRNANHDNTATLIPVAAGITRADVQALVNQNPNPPSGAGILPAHVNRFNAARAMAQNVANPSSPNLQHTNEELITASFVNAIMVFENAITRMHSAIARAEQQ
jgi:hypothetical protein